MRAPSPAEVLAALVVTSGVGIVLVNGAEPDESRTMGLALAILGGLGLAAEVVGRRGAVRATRKWRGVLRRAIETAVVTLLLLGGGELMVRRENARGQLAYTDSLMHFVEDPTLRYELKPRVSCGDSTTNSRGMIDVEREPNKPSGVLRIACLGDSVGGDCSLPRDNACAALERSLTIARGGRPVEVLNFSVPGYNTLQEARALELKALQFEPDAVVVLYVINDPYPDLAITHFLPGHFKLQHMLWSGAQLAAWKLVGAHVDPFGGVIERLYESPRAWDGVVVSGFGRIRKAAKARPVLVAVFPLFMDGLKNDYLTIYPRVVVEAERHGFMGVDLSREAFADVPLEDLLKPSRDSIHPNAHAHGLAAEVIAKNLLKRYPALMEK